MEYKNNQKHGKQRIMNILYTYNIKYYILLREKYINLNVLI